MTAQQLITDALQELGIGAAGETLDSAVTDVGLNKLARIVDNWNAEREAIYADQIQTFTLTPSLQPHTIGPTGTWVTAQRPVSIEGAHLNLASGATTPIDWRHTMAWYEALPAPTLTSGQPTDLAYNPTWPNGALYFWPIPTSALTVTLLTRGILSAYTLASTLTVPPGYRDALTLTLAEECAASFGLEAKPQTVLSATKARARIFVNNLVVPPLRTAAAGMPGTGGGWFDYQTGMMR